jgi:membrane fusion protein (multidrug efflux system)
MTGARKGLAGAALAAALAALGAGCGPGEPPAPPSAEVGVVAAHLGSVPDRREYVGNVRAVTEIDVRARVRGYLTERLFREGQAVAAGDVLFRIDPSSFELALAEARGSLARTRAARKRADADFQRARELRAGNVVSQAQLDAAREAIDAAAAEQATAEAAVAAAELDLSWCTVRAPAAGRIGLALVDVGNLVGESGQDTVLARIVQVDPIHVYFAPTEIERLEVLRSASSGAEPGSGGGVQVELRLGDGTRYPHPGLVDFVAPSVDETRGTVQARALVPNPEDLLKPGAFVRVVAVFPEVPDAVLVPERAVLDEQGGSYVLVVGADDKVEHRSVRAASAQGGLRRIVEGLSAGERVIVEGVQKARPGDRVVARELEAPATAEAAAKP